MRNKTHAFASDRLAVPARQVAILLSISERHVWKLDATGLIPSPVRLGRAVRWSVPDLEAWQAAGCPSREEWELIKNKKETS